MKRILSLTSLVIFLTIGASAQSTQPHPVNCNVSSDGLAIDGYDPVAFFTESRPVMGQDSLMLQWNGATWYFSDRKNLESFKSAPERYAPQYGGYCAYGTAQGHKAPTQVDTWTILDGKLYFNYNQKVKEAWSKDRPGMIKKADESWPMIKDKG